MSKLLLFKELGHALPVHVNSDSIRVLRCSQQDGHGIDEAMLQVVGEMSDESQSYLVIVYSQEDFMYLHAATLRNMSSDEFYEYAKGIGRALYGSDYQLSDEYIDELRVPELVRVSDTHFRHGSFILRYEMVPKEYNRFVKFTPRARWFYDDCHVASSLWDDDKSILVLMNTPHVELVKQLLRWIEDNTDCPWAETREVFTADAFCAAAKPLF